MAKKKNGANGYAGKNWQEADLIETFQLKRIKAYQTPLLKEWLDVLPPELNIPEQYNFDMIFNAAVKSIEGWSEEDLKMKFLSPVLVLGHLSDDDKVVGFFDKTISATVAGIPLTVKSDFMLARGLLNRYKTPFFHFQEYKPQLNPAGEPMAQLLEAFLIAQVKNENGKPIYGAEINGAYWRFVVMEDKSYCISNTYEATKKEDLLSIISILRKFRTILYEKLMD
jgi:hypothetical protein